MKTILSKDTIKTDGYVPRLQQFWLDAMAPLAAVLDSVEAIDLMLERWSRQLKLQGF